MTPSETGPTRKMLLKQIEKDPEIQQRVGMHQWAIKDYADALRRGDKFPPVVVFFDGQKFWLADGFHRIEAAEKVGLQHFEAEVRNGTKRDALLFAVTANENHGLRRSIADKCRAVMTMLQDPEWSQWSNRQIAKHCKVSHSFVNKLRNSPDKGVAQSQSVPADEEKRSVFFAIANGKEGRVYKFGDPNKVKELVVIAKSYTQGVGIVCKMVDGKERFIIYQLEYEKNNPKKLLRQKKRYVLSWDRLSECYEFTSCIKPMKATHPGILGNVAISPGEHIQEDYDILRSFLKNAGLEDKLLEFDELERMGKT